MAASSSASIAASKLLNLRNSSLQSLIRRHLLLHPAAANARSLNLLDLKTDSIVNSPKRISDPMKSNLCASDLPLNLQWRFGFSSMRIEAARTYVPSTLDDDNMMDFEDEDEDDGDAMYHYVDDDDEEDEDEDEDDDRGGSRNSDSD